MSNFYDEHEIQDVNTREDDLFKALPQFIHKAKQEVSGLARWLKGVDIDAIQSRKQLAKLPVLYKSHLLELQQEFPPFGDFVHGDALKGRRIFMSPGPIFVPEGVGADPWQCGRAFHAAGITSDDIIHNAFSYHMTPGGFIVDSITSALGCTVFPAGVGNTQMQVEAAAILKPTVYCGTPDFLKIMLDYASEHGHDLSSIKRACVSGGALFPSLRAEYNKRGISVSQFYATAEIGVIAYESFAPDGSVNPGMILNENIILEIVRPGSGDCVPLGQVGEILVTRFCDHYPLIRLGTGDLSAIMAEKSPCGRTNTRIKGWMGRADQRTKIKGMFVDPKQITQLMERHHEIKKARLVVTRNGDSDQMDLLIEANGACDIDAIEGSLRDITKLSGRVKLADTNSFPNDGKIIADERDYSQ